MLSRVQSIVGLLANLFAKEYFTLGCQLATMMSSGSDSQNLNSGDPSRVKTLPASATAQSGYFAGGTRLQYQHLRRVGPSDCPSPHPFATKRSLHISRKNHFDVLSGRTSEPNVSQEVLECLYKMSKSPQHEPRTMNWRHVAKKMNTFGNELESQEETIARGDEYTVLRKEVVPCWELMRSSYQKAAVAYSKGEKAYAAILSEEGKKYSQMGQQAEERASQEIFRARNKNIENVITIDLHGQHVKQAMRLLKFHLLLPSIQKLKVITGCGSHGVGKSKLKQSVIRLIEREGIKWSEENQGMVVLKLDQRRNFSFVDADSDSD